MKKFTNHTILSNRITIVKKMPFNVQLEEEDLEKLVDGGGLNLAIILDGINGTIIHI